MFVVVASSQLVASSHFLSPWRPCGSRGHSGPAPSSSFLSSPSPSGPRYRHPGSSAHARRRHASRSTHGSERVKCFLLLKGRQAQVKSEGNMRNVSKAAVLKQNTVFYPFFSNKKTLISKAFNKTMLVKRNNIYFDFESLREKQKNLRCKDTSPVTYRFLLLPASSMWLLRS